MVFDLKALWMSVLWPQWLFSRLSGLWGCLEGSKRCSKKSIEAPPGDEKWNVLELLWAQSWLEIGKIRRFDQEFGKPCQIAGFQSLKTKLWSSQASVATFQIYIIRRKISSNCLPVCDLLDLIYNMKPDLHWNGNLKTVKIRIMTGHSLARFFFLSLYVKLSLHLSVEKRNSTALNLQTLLCRNSASNP